MALLRTPDIENLLRFARLFSGSEEAAETAVARACQAVLPAVDGEDNRREIRLELYEEIWKLRDSTPKTAAAGPALPDFLADLTPVQKAGLALSYLEKMSPLEIEEVCGLSPGNLKEFGLRQAKASANSWKQTPVAAAAVARLAALEQDLVKTPPVHFSLLSPAGLSLIFALLALGGVFGWSALHGNPYDELPLTLALVAQTENIVGEDLEPVDVPAGDLPDWLFLKHGLDDVQVPEALAPLQAAFCGVTRVENHPVAQIALRDSKALLFICRASDFDLPENRPAQWTVFSRDEWAVAVQVRGDDAWFLVLPGGKSEMESFLAATTR